MTDVQNLQEDTSKRNDKGLKGQLPEALYAFRAGGATTNLIFVITEPTEKNWEHGKHLLMVFIDCKQAFDSVRKEEIWKSL
jgi:hypothetical protein